MLNVQTWLLSYARRMSEVKSGVLVLGDTTLNRVFWQWLTGKYPLLVLYYC